MQPVLSDGELNELRRWSTCAVFNGWEQITRRDIVREAINLEPAQDFMPFLGPMVGYAATVVIQPSDPKHKQNNPNAWSEYRRYVASIPGPKIVVMQDLDKPRLLGSFWGEVTSNFHRSLGCVGAIVDGAIRDVDEMGQAGFKALARGLCVGHAHACPIRWGGEVEVFGRRIAPGQLIHADKHGFLALPPGDERELLEATRFMDALECQTVIVAARDARGKSPVEICDALDRAGEAFQAAAREKFGRKVQTKSHQKSAVTRESSKSSHSRNP
jgi:4-hydroxy-4-methyl-2-oxoglutarate aldolase